MSNDETIEVRGSEGPEEGNPAGENTARMLATISSLLVQVAEPARDLEEVMHLICAHAQRLTGSSGAVIEMVEGDVIVYRSASGSIATHEGFRLPRAGTFTGLAIETGEVQIADDTELDPRVDRAAACMIGARSMLIVPLRFSGRTIGVLKVISEKPGWFRRDHEQTLGLLAGVLGLAIAHAEDRDLNRESTGRGDESERLWRGVVQQSISGIYIIQDSRFTYANDRFLEMIGYTLEELISLRSALDIVVPEERPTAEAYVVARATGELDAVHYEMTCLRQDGSHVVLEVFGGGVELKTGQALIATAIDVTGRRQAEEMLRESERWFRNLIEGSSDMFAVLTLEGEYTYSSPSVRDQLGYEPYEIVGRNAFDFVHHDDLRRVKGEIESIINADPHNAAIRVRLRHKSGRWRECEAGLRLVSDPYGTPVLVSVSRDVTDAHRLERETADADRLVALGRVASAMAHEFNNVLMGIQPHAELIKRYTDPAKIASAADRIQAGVKRGKSITQQVLRFTRSEPAVRRVVAVRDILATVELEIQAQLPSNVTLQIDRQGELFVLADPAQIEQTLVNLCLNSRDAMPAGGTISIQAAASEKRDYPYGMLRSSGDHFVRISVVDNGTGIPPELMERIFEPLFTTKKGEGGSGLGLSVAKHIAASNEGVLFIESEPGRGTALHLFLVRGEDVPAASHSGELTFPPIRRILLVEDDDLVAHGLRTMLSEWTGEVERVATGGAAAAAALSFSPDLVLLDYGLPDMPGTAVYRILRARSPRLPIVFMTGHADGQLVRDEIGTKEFHICFKPFETADLVAVMTDAVADMAKG